LDARGELPGASDSLIVLGLRQNWSQFVLLVFVNAFVGAMVGLERAVLPLIADQEFGIASRLAILSFVASFGAAKAAANLLAGRLGDKHGRKPVLVAGWLLGLPVPFIVMAAPTWAWIVGANVLLGLNQGLAWSATVIMKVDLVGPRNRGLAMGINESAGYVAVSLAALASGFVASTYGLRPYPFYLGVAFAALGVLSSVFLVRETVGHARQEAAERGASEMTVEAQSFSRTLLVTSWKNRTLFSVSQAGLVNNLNDGLAWGLFPLFFAAGGISLEQIGVLAALYPAVWGLGQLVTGALSDRVGRKPLIVAGMWIQAGAIAAMLAVGGVPGMALAMGALGAGTALVYPTLLASVSDVAHPTWRATSIGVYRLWRDGGYVVGALAAGLMADWLGMPGAIAAVAGLTALSGVVVLATMQETHHRDLHRTVVSVPEVFR
jgi:MFS family permease